MSKGKSVGALNGLLGTVTPDQARKHAKELLGRVAKGDNPAEERAKHRGASNVAA
ncbi:MAG: integrase arm-type DNA-binding domain-containing protein, partial [Rhodospirillaceae bacterium]|nr:integrase arm-type DNA-binding domain-containing protein [Rhodospirillaceae bacterium]